MGILKSVKRGFIYGGLIGALAGSQFPSIPQAYKEVLEADIKQKEFLIDHIKDNKDKYLDRDTYRATLDEVRSDYNEAKDKLKGYDSLDRDDQKKEALKDIGNYGMTLKEMDFGLSKQSGKGAKKGAIAGASTGVLLLGGLSVRGAVRKRKEKKSLEKRLSVFLSLIAGGIGVSMVFSNFSGVVTGNVIQTGAYQTSGLFGIFLLVVGCVGSYFYFKN
jgi:hypothetical protein